MARDHERKPETVNPYAISDETADDNLNNLIQNWDVLSSRLVVFLGAGASIGARNRRGDFLPGAYSLRDEMWRRFMCGPGERDAFDSTKLGTMSLEHAAALCEARAGRLAVQTHVRDRFDCAKPLWHHFVLPYLAPRALFTTNYDELIERGWRAHGNSLGSPELKLVTSAAKRPATAHTPLYKPHGTIEHAFAPPGEEGGIVVTMFDYFTMIADYEKMIESFLEAYNETCVIFLGYAFQDLDIGAVLYRMRKKRDVPWYAVFPRNDPDVRRMYQDRFDIRQINRRAVTFMADLDRELDLIPPTYRFDQIEELKRQGLIQ